jgi:hypothetical protein
MGLQVDQPVRGKQIRHRLALIVMVLQQQPTSRCQGPRSLQGDAADAGQAIATAIQSQARLVIAHHRIQLIHHS